MARDSRDFEVRTSSPLDEQWEARDEQIEIAAGRHSDYSGAGLCRRDHGWYCKTLDEAKAMKYRLQAVAGTLVTIRERTTE